MSTKNYDSEICGSIPIHQINLIQPYGALIVVQEASLEVLQVSENVTEAFGLPFEEVVGMKLDELVSKEAIHDLKLKLNSAKEETIPATWNINGRAILALVHRRGAQLLVEIDLVRENNRESSFVEVYQDIRYAMSLVQSASSIKEVAETTARELKRISGFDKVMVYSFDKHWNGTVLAEAMEPGMESYLGFTFPASDIPPQARLLYLRSPYRFIPDRDYKPVKLYPIINPGTQSFIDLSSCNVRAVPAVHIEYLKNMNVAASMSTRILSGDKLWGLIACHHRTAKAITFEMRSMFEMMSNVVSSRVQNVQLSEVHALDLLLRENYKDIIEEAYRNENIAEVLLNGKPDLLQLFNAQGAAITRKGMLYTRGVTPDHESINELILWLHTRHLKSTFHTDSLSEHYDNASAFKKEASGLLVIPLNAAQDEYILVFRSETLRTINWGGDPNERIQYSTDKKNYHPRNSFAMWQELVEGTSAPWRDEEVAVAENLRSFIFEFHS